MTSTSFPLFEVCTCQKGCCIIRKRTGYVPVRTDFRYKYNKPKAGVFIHDDCQKRILLVQSRGQKWGPPKGTMETSDSSLEDCAIRELFEETGIGLDKSCFTRTIQINRASYFDVSASVTPVLVRDRDITGYTWMHLDCVHEMDLNSHCKQLLRKVFFLST